MRGTPTLQSPTARRYLKGVLRVLGMLGAILAVAALIVWLGGCQSIFAGAQIECTRIPRTAGALAFSVYAVGIGALLTLWWVILAAALLPPAILEWRARRKG
ncbi:MAG: hypothetical protein AAGE76_13775 [Pseudomonadota bacterium]